MSKKSTKIIAAAGVVAGLGVAALPALTFATQQTTTGQVTLTADVESAIAMTIHGNGDGDGVNGVDSFSPAGVASGDVAGHPTPATSNTGPSSSTVSLLPNAADTTTATSDITVYTNASGYTLSVQDADDNNALTKTGASIPAVSTTNTLEAGHSAWGYKVSGGSAWLAVPTTDDDPASITPAASGTAINIIYGVSTSASQATGTYTDTIVYTAMTAN